jgi:Xaa-Pro aminopeptidase
MKMVENSAEIRNMREAHIRDGSAMVQFLSSLQTYPCSDELALIERLETTRAQDDTLTDISFDTICGSGPNGAIIRYRASPQSNRTIDGEGELILLDSGGQYARATTDITRTFWLGENAPPKKMIEDFTLVLKAHIKLASSSFPKGTTGIQLDAITRLPLWRAKRDCPHGTGHGVGAGLSVHEGPCGIRKRAQTPLQADVILSNEPRLCV